MRESRPRPMVRRARRRGSGGRAPSRSILPPAVRAGGRISRRGRPGNAAALRPPASVASCGLAPWPRGWVPVVPGPGQVAGLLSPAGDPGRKSRGPGRRPGLMLQFRPWWWLLQRLCSFFLGSRPGRSGKRGSLVFTSYVFRESDFPVLLSPLSPFRGLTVTRISKGLYI